MLKALVRLLPLWAVVRLMALVDACRRLFGTAAGQVIARVLGVPLPVMGGAPETKTSLDRILKEHYPPGGIVNQRIV